MNDSPPPIDNLPPVSDEALARFDAVCPDAEAEVVELCLAADAPETSMGPEAGATLKSGMRFVSQMLRASMRYSAGEIIADELEWGRARLPFHGVTAEMVLRNLARYQQALERRLPTEAFAAVRPYLEAMTRRQQAILKSIESGSQR